VIEPILVTYLQEHNQGLVLQTCYFKTQDVLVLSPLSTSSRISLPLWLVC